MCVHVCVCVCACVCVDIIEQKLEVAKVMGADQVLRVDTKDSEKLANQIKDTMGVAPDIAIECTGMESSTAAAIYVSMCMTLSHLSPAVTRQPIQEVW